MSGFKLKEEEVANLKLHYAKVPMVVPAEIVRSYSFTTAPSNNGLNCVLNLAMNNVKEINVLFPRLASDLTCFLNPMLTHLQLRFNNRVYPERGIQTNTHQFLRYQTENANLDSILPATESFENSIISPVQSKKPFRDRSKCDNTSFSFIIPVERQSANAFFFDGVNSDHETIHLTGTPVENRDGKNTYLYHNRHNNEQTETYRNTTPPVICLCSDTFWLFTSTQHAVYETSRTWNEVFRHYFPELYNQLLVEAGIKNPLRNTRGNQRPYY
jgi:hypothetical protein